MLDKPRELALKALVKLDQEESYTNLVIDEIIHQNKQKLTDKDIGFITELIYGVTTWKLTLDEIIRFHSTIRLKKISIWILNVLRMGIYQILYLDKIPTSAAVNESVNLAKRYGHAASSKFVNAILRKVTREDKKRLTQITDPKERIAKTTSTPLWLVEKLSENRKLEQVETICQSFTTKPKITIRINELKITPAEFTQELTQRNIPFEVVSPDCPEFIQIERIKDLEHLDLFQRGYFIVQDLSAGFTVRLLNPKAGQLVLDACAAPGGKTTYLAEKMKNQGKIIAWDLHQHRTELIKQNANRLGITIIEPETQDATIPNSKYHEIFDQILLDVPCLGIGVIRKKPDIKWQKKEEDIPEITNVQNKLLEVVQNYLKPGGQLVYSTCSILKEENQDIVNEFLANHPNFEIFHENEISMKYFQKYQDKQGFYQIDPSPENDGFFMAKLQKK